MTRKYANYGLPSPEAKSYRTVHTWMAAQLHVMAWMNQEIVEVAVGGPEWVFQRDGKEVSTRPALTLSKADGRTAYWSALERHFTGDFPDWVKVQKYHAERHGASIWVLTDEYIQNNAVEFRNRTDAYHFLAHARGWNSSEVERDLLMAIHRTPRTIGDLEGVLKRPQAHVLAAALRLWRKRLLVLPMATRPMADDWLVHGVNHGLR